MSYVQFTPSFHAFVPFSNKQAAHRDPRRKKKVITIYNNSSASATRWVRNLTNGTKQWIHWYMHCRFSFRSFALPIFAIATHIIPQTTVTRVAHTYEIVTTEARASGRDRETERDISSIDVCPIQTHTLDRRLGAHTTMQCLLCLQHPAMEYHMHSLPLAIKDKSKRP